MRPSTEEDRSPSKSSYLKSSKDTEIRRAVDNELSKSKNISRLKEVASRLQDQREKIGEKLQAIKNAIALLQNGALGSKTVEEVVGRCLSSSEIDVSRSKTGKGAKPSVGSTAKSSWSRETGDRSRRRKIIKAIVFSETEMTLLEIEEVAQKFDPEMERDDIKRALNRLDGITQIENRYVAVE